MLVTQDSPTVLVFIEQNQPRPSEARDKTSHTHFSVSRPLRILAVSGRELGLTSLTLLPSHHSPDCRPGSRATQLFSMMCLGSEFSAKLFLTADYLNLSILCLYFSFIDRKKIMNEKHFSL